MKYLKKYENLKNKPNFKEGDHVICIDNEHTILTKGMRYLVKRIFENGENYVCRVNSKLRKIGENLGTFSCDRFVEEIEYESEKYNL